MNLNVIRKRVEALERLAVSKSGNHDSADILSPRDAAFLIVERLRLDNAGGTEATLLVSRIDEIIRRHENAIKVFRPPQLSALEANDALMATRERTEADEKQYGLKWQERLRAEREPSKENTSDFYFIKG